MLGVLAIGMLLALTTSCKKECTCTAKDMYGNKEVFTEFPENYNTKNCSELGRMVSGSGVSVTCN